MTETYDRGMKVRREVLGDAHVNRAEACKSDIDLPFQTLITQSAWGRSGDLCLIYRSGQQNRGSTVFGR